MVSWAISLVAFLWVGVALLCSLSARVGPAVHGTLSVTGVKSPPNLQEMEAILNAPEVKAENHSQDIPPTVKWLFKERRCNEGKAVQEELHHLQPHSMMGKSRVEGALEVCHPTFYFRQSQTRLLRDFFKMAGS